MINSYVMDYVMGKIKVQLILDEDNLGFAEVY